MSDGVGRRRLGAPPIANDDAELRGNSAKPVCVNKPTRESTAGTTRVYFGGATAKPAFLEKLPSSFSTFMTYAPTGKCDE